MNRVALYARVSTHNGQDPEMQLREMREYCLRRELVITGEPDVAGRRFLAGRRCQEGPFTRLAACSSQGAYDCRTPSK